MFTVNILLEDDVLQTTGLSQQQLDQVIIGIQQAANLWARYIDNNNAVIDIALDFQDLSGPTLAEAGSIFFRQGNGPFESEVITELNGAAGFFSEDGTFTIDLPTLLDGKFFFSNSLEFDVNPGAPGQIDFLTLAAHELGHVLGFLGLSFEGFVNNSGQFIGANAVAANGGNPVELSADEVHTTGDDLLSPSISSNLREPINAVHIGILQDLGIPIVQATDAADTLYGFNQNDDLLNGKGGDDTIYGLTGDDTLNGGFGKDVLFGGSGADKVNGNNDIDRLYGQGGDDILDGGAASDFLYGGSNNDTLFGNNGNDRLFGGGGEDILNGGTGRDRADYQNSNDGIIVNLIDTSINTGDAAGDTYISIEDIGGTGGNDELTGDGQANRIYANSGDDTVNGEGGDDRIFGAAGEDILNGGDSNDDLYGAADNDTLNGDNGSDRLYGGSGDDILFGGNQNDRLAGNSGMDLLNGGNGQDRLFGGDDNDILIGGIGDDFLRGDRGEDQLNGGTGNDRIYGNSDNDILSGGTGNDALYGGNGSDIFIFEAGYEADRIVDFEDGLDLIDLSDFTNAEVNAALSGISQIGSSAVLDFGNGDTLTLVGTNVGDITIDDVI